MNQDLFRQIFRKQQNLETVPPNDVIAEWATKVICLLYPELSESCDASVEEMERHADSLRKELITILDATMACKDSDNAAIALNFFLQLPDIYKVLNTDADAILNGDPAAKSEFEVIRAYPGFFALCFYRIGHTLFKLDVPLIPRILTEYAHSKTGIDIHPGSVIGEYFHIDHGTGIVIGETTIIGNNVKMYQGVTLGALSVDKSMAYMKRHPTIEDHVILYSNATILGGETVVGHHSVIGGNVWLTHSVPPGSLVYHDAEVRVLEGKTLNS
jgi:serine O-acetyltransferase